MSASSASAAVTFPIERPTHPRRLEASNIFPSQSPLISLLIMYQAYEVTDEKTPTRWVRLLKCTIGTSSHIRNYLIPNVLACLKNKTCKGTVSQQEKPSLIQLVTIW